MQGDPIGFVLVVLSAGNAESGIDLSWEGQAELELSVGPLIRGRFLNMDIGILNRIEHRADVTLHIEGRRYELTAVERSEPLKLSRIGDRSIRLRPGSREDSG